MKKGNIIRPTGLKGNDKVNRMRELMGQVPINEGVKRSVVELTKEGPDGKVYAIVRENHEYYIKVSENKSNLVTEDFQYIGGLQNKKDKAYPSYAKAIKQLNLKFMSLNEAIGRKGQINVFEDDNLINEHHPLSADMKLSASKGIGDGQEYVVDKKGAELKADAKEGKEEDGFGDNVADSTAEKDMEEVKLNETEEAIDEMIGGEEEESKEEVKKGYSITKAIQEMDSIIGELSGEDEKIDAILETLGEDERAIMIEALKKNVNETYSRENAEQRLIYLASDKGVNLKKMDDKTRNSFVVGIMKGIDITNELLKFKDRTHSHVDSPDYEGGVNEALKKKD